MTLDVSESLGQSFRAAPIVIEKMPVYRYFNGKDHFFGSDYSEIGTANRGQVGKHGYTSEAAAFHCLASNTPGHGIRAVPVYRYFNGADHHYTTNPGEIGTTTPGQQGNYGYKSEGVAFYALDSPNPAPRVRGIPVYRYFNGVDHFFTADTNEIGTITAGQQGKHGYKCEGLAWYAPA